MKGIMAVVVVTLATLFIAAPASAQGLGLGWDSGIALRGNAGDVGLEGVLGFSNTSYEDEDIDSDTSMDLSGYASFPMVTRNTSVLGLFAGLGISTFTDWDTDFAIRGGLEHRVMVTSQIGLTGKAGLEVLVVGGREDVADSGWTTIGTFGSIGVFWFFGE